jgi:hypothetical protein
MVPNTDTLYNIVNLIYTKESVELQHVYRHINDKMKKNLDLWKSKIDAQRLNSQSTTT